MSDSSLLGTVTDPGYVPTSDDKTMATLSHVLCFVAGFIAPLIIYLIKKDESPFVAAHAKESLNFQITCWIVIFLLTISVVGIFLLIILGPIMAILVIIATIRSSEGKLYRYPFAIRLIK